MVGYTSSDRYVSGKNTCIFFSQHSQNSVKCHPLALQLVSTVKKTKSHIGDACRQVEIGHDNSSDYFDPVPECRSAL